MSTDPAHQRLAEVARRDRSRRYASRRAFAEATGIGKRTVDKLETGVRITYSARTRARVEPALGWADGSIESVLGGGDPIYVADPLLAEFVDQIWPHLSYDARAMLVQLARDALLPNRP